MDELHSATDASSERVPRLRVVPVPQCIRTFFDQVLGGPVVKPGVEFVDDRLIANDGKNAN